MSFDPELLKTLTVTFKAELDEHLQMMTNELLTLEKAGNDTGLIKDKIESIFRSAHTIKGASRGLGINPIGDIAHRIESLFSLIQKKEMLVSKPLIDVCLEAIDKIKSCMQSHLDQTSIHFDLPEFLLRLESVTNSQKETTTLQMDAPIENIEQKTVHEEEKKIPSAPDLSVDTIRVPISKIEKVSALMEEIQINKIAIDDQYGQVMQLINQVKQFNQLWKQFNQKMREEIKPKLNEGLERFYYSCNDCLMETSSMMSHLQKNMWLQLNELSLLSTSLQEEIRTLRLVPANHFLGHLPRYVRDLSQSLNKEVELTIKGAEVKIDKFVLDGLKDPLIHLLRNAIDHGIEDADIRKSNGKPAIGKIDIEIREEGSQIVIDISDDGAGIDVKKIAATAEDKKLFSSVEINAMSEEETINLIFSPGFSTKKMITDVSGRGVGLNVVKTNLNDLNGRITVQSTVGSGTIFSLRVPFTLCSERGLLISSDAQLFVIPIHAVERVLMVSDSDLLEVGGSQAILLDDSPVSLTSLFDVLNFEKVEKCKENTFSVIVIKHNEHRVALLVDRIIGERELVIKRVNLPLANVKCVAGATLLDRNQAVLVLNPSDLIDAALHTHTVHRIALQDKGVEAIARPHILVVDDSITTRTLEKNILENRNYQVTVAVNGKEAWDMLQKQTFSLLITDVSMPVMNGFELTEHVKRSDKLKQLPVIIVTSLDSETEKARGIEVGANAYIVKNQFESETLLEIVEQLV